MPPTHGLRLLSSLVCQQAHVVIRWRDVASTSAVPICCPTDLAAPPNESRLAAGGSRTKGEGARSEVVCFYSHCHRDWPPSGIGRRAAPLADPPAGFVDGTVVLRTRRGRRRRWGFSPPGG